MNIYCCGCAATVEARLTTGAEIYSHRPDLKSLPFWKCDTCGSYCGCHHKTNNPTYPIGTLSTKELRNARMHIHKILDPIWQSGVLSRKEVYSKISKALGKNYHTAEIRSVEEARKIYVVVSEMSKTLL